jgi:hypothetical protein
MEASASPGPSTSGTLLRVAQRHCNLVLCKIGVQDSSRSASMIVDQL